MPEPHPVIWLQPWCQECASSENRTWCNDNVWPHGCEECGTMPDKYVLAEEVPEIQRLRDENELLRDSKGCAILDLKDEIERLRAALLDRKQIIKNLLVQNERLIADNKRLLEQFHGRYSEST